MLAFGCCKNAEAAVIYYFQSRPPHPCLLFKLLHLLLQARIALPEGDFEAKSNQVLDLDSLHQPRTEV